MKRFIEVAVGVGVFILPWAAIEQSWAATCPKGEYRVIEYGADKRAGTPHMPCHIEDRAFVCDDNPQKQFKDGELYDIIPCATASDRRPGGALGPE